MITLKNCTTIVVMGLVLGVVLSGCGFHLRGQIELPALYKRVHLVDQGYADVAVPLTEALTGVGSEMVADPAKATSVITLLSRGVQERALAVGGKSIREFELQLDVSFVVQDASGETVGEPSTVSEVRSYQNLPNEVLGKEDEATIIMEEMRQSIVRKILYRLKALAK